MKVYQVRWADVVIDQTFKNKYLAHLYIRERSARGNGRYYEVREITVIEDKDQMLRRTQWKKFLTVKGTRT